MNTVGIGTRILNFLVDNFIIALPAYAAYHGWSFYVFYYGILYIPVYYFWAIVTFLYYLLFEGWFKRTPGKYISLTKVVSINGTTPSFWQIVVRSFIRVIGFIVLDAMWIAFNGKTLHDYLSKTLVIEK